VAEPTTLLRAPSVSKAPILLEMPLGYFLDSLEREFSERQGRLLQRPGRQHPLDRSSAALLTALRHRPELARSPILEVANPSSNMAIFGGRFLMVEVGDHLSQGNYLPHE
jgi:hypothetical protein